MQHPRFACNRVLGPFLGDKLDLSGKFVADGAIGVWLQLPDISCDVCASVYQLELEPVSSPMTVA